MSICNSPTMDHNRSVSVQDKTDVYDKESLNYTLDFQRLNDDGLGVVQKGFYKPKRPQPEITEEPYNLKIFDKLDSILVKQQQFINKNKQNNERALIKILKLDALQSEKAKEMLQNLEANNKPSKSKKKKTNKKHNKSMLIRNTILVNGTSRYQLDKYSIRAFSKNNMIVKDNLSDIQQQMNSVVDKMNQHQLSFEELRYKPEFNISIFKFQNREKAISEGWERLSLNPNKQQIKSRISDIDTELQRVNDIFVQGEKSMNRYLNVQYDLMTLKQRIRNEE